jgi:hypothetical protein
MIVSSTRGFWPKTMLPFSLHCDLKESQTSNALLHFNVSVCVETESV